jgi:response regulator RpfG family c-di-GMP phosphodiesterase
MSQASSEPHDELFFAEEEEEQSPDLDYSGDGPWQILVVDDDEEVHRVTRLVLDGFEYKGRPLIMHHASSAAEARRILPSIPDDELALVLLDVVMESDDAGLKIVRYIREELANSFIRIVLRTGQPGQAPEERVIVDYDINDYKSKTDLTVTKLKTTVITSLRSFRDIITIERNKRGLRKVIDASPTIFKMQSLSNFTSGVLEQLVSLMNLGRSSMFCHGFTAHPAANGEMVVKAATGDYSPWVNHPVDQAVPDVIRNLLFKAKEASRSILEGNNYVGYLPGKAGTCYLIFVHGWEELKPWDQDLINLFFTNVAVGHDNIQLNLEIEETQSEVIFTLGEIAEARSKETGNHVRRVAKYSELLALKAGVPATEARILKLASPMHDVGKLAIPDSILNKPGRLTAEEWEIMKTHAEIGGEMLMHSDRPLMQAASVVASQHHEKWNGSGYPKGLQGEEIHIYGRVLAVADVFDALSVRRVYKEAWPLPRVIAYFEEESGKHFDPNLVRLLIENIDEFLEIRQNYTVAWERGEA